MKFLGHIICPKDGYTYITNPNQVCIYFSLDSSEFLTEVLCAKCGTIINGIIDREFLLAFMGHGVKIIPYGNRFSALTEDMITSWDIEGELKGLNASCKN